MQDWLDTTQPVVPKQTNIYVGNWHGSKDELHKLAESYGDLVEHVIFSKLENKGLCGYVSLNV